MRERGFRTVMFGFGESWSEMAAVFAGLVMPAIAVANDVKLRELTRSKFLASGVISGQASPPSAPGNRRDLKQAGHMGTAWVAAS